MAAITYKCPNCGGELVFDPDIGKYKCPFCTSVFTQEELDRLKPAKAEEEKISAEGGSSAEYASSAQAEGEAVHTESEQAAAQSAVIYRCPSCGAEIVTDETTAATFCYYCHNPVILEGRLSGKMLPDKVIPFKIGRKQAVEEFRAYIRSKKFVPKAFWDDRQIEKLSGVYYPYWETDVDERVSMDAEGRKLRVWVAGDVEYTETEIYQVGRAGTVKLEHMISGALKKADRELAAGVQPFRPEEAVDFQMSYLSGFMAERRDMEKTEFEASLRASAAKYSETILRETAGGYGSLRVTASDYNPVKEDWKYMLLPVWVLTYRGIGGKMYYYAMNGQTGTVCGKLPVDRKKLFLWSAALALFVFVLVLLGGYLL